MILPGTRTAPAPPAILPAALRERRLGPLVSFRLDPRFRRGTGVRLGLLISLCLSRRVEHESDFCSDSSELEVRCFGRLPIARGVGGGSDSGRYRQPKSCAGNGSAWPSSSCKSRYQGRSDNVAGGDTAAMAAPLPGCTCTPAGEDASADSPATSSPIANCSRITAATG